MTQTKKYIERDGTPGSMTLRVVEMRGGTEDPYGGIEYDERVTVGQYCFDVRGEADRADRIRGEAPETNSKTAVYIGDNTAKHYTDGHDIDEVPEEVWNHLAEEGYVVLDNVEGDWAQWDGRPEFSESYIDYSDAEVVEPEERAEAE
jgi:hypothetical protein